MSSQRETLPHNLAVDATVAVSPATARAMARMRAAVYGVLGVLVLGAIVASVALLILLGDVAQLVQNDAEREAQAQLERSGRTERLADALERIDAEHDHLDEVSARRLEVLRDDLLAHLHALEDEPTPHPPPAPLPRREDVPR